LVLLNQAPAAPEEPILVLIAPPDTAGVPAHVVEFAQEHVAEQARGRGLTVIRMKDFLKKLPSARRRALLKCKRTDLKCLTALGQAAKSEVVLVAELLQRMDGYRVGTKVYKTQDGGLVAENLIPGVREDGMLDALTQSLDVVVPKLVQELRPGSVPPPPVNPPPVTEGTGEPKPPVAEGTGEPKPPVAEGTGEPKPPLVEKPPEVKKEPEPPAHPWAWVPAAGGAVFAGAGTYFYLQAKDNYDTLANEGNADQPLDGDQLASDGKRNQMLSRVSFGLAAAGVITTTVLYLLPTDKKAPVSPTVSVGPGGAMVGVVGTLP
jgi:hypothetical protein